MEAMGRESTDAEIAVASEQEVALYKKRLHSGPTLEGNGLRLYLGKEMSCAWNRRAAELLADDFIASGYSSCTDRELVIRIARTHFRTLQDQYKRQCHGNVETEREREERIGENREQRRRGISLSRI